MVFAVFLAVLPAIPAAFARPPAPFVVEPPPNAAYPDYGPAGNIAAARLRREPSKMITFDRAALRDVLRYLADDAGIPFISIKEADQANHQLVTFTMEASPFVALESVCRNFGVELSYQDGVWFMKSELSKTKDLIEQMNQRRIDEERENMLVGKIYRLNYDPVDRVDFRASLRRSSSGGSSGGSSSESGNSSPSTPEISLQNSQRVFQPSIPRLVNDIRTMLGLGPVTVNEDGIVTGEEVERGTNSAGTVAESGIIPNASGQVNYTPGYTSRRTTRYSETEYTIPSKTDEKGAEKVENIPTPLNPIYIPPQMPQVIYNTDNNTLWIVATKQQHEWIADYLLAVDKQQALIAIEVKFFETTKNPSKEFGINWKGTMHPDPINGDGGMKFTASNIKASPSGSIDYMTGKSYGASAGTAGTNPSIGSGGPNIQGGAVDPGTGANLDGWAATKGATLTAGAPYSAVLTATDMQLALQAFMSDDKTSMVQYPRVLTVNNREVAITSAENTPINKGVSQTSASGSAPQNVGTLGYLPVGTQINILPKAIGADQVALAVAITISDILRYDSLNLGTGFNLYPVTSARIFNASLQVHSGYTLAVGGLETTGDARIDNGIPVLQDIPGVGQFFKSKTRTRKKKNLIIFITPTVIVNLKETRGISETPESVIPVRPNDPTPPAFTPDGQLVGGKDAIPAAFAWFDFQIKWFKQINKENRTDHETIKQLRAVISSARMLVSNIANMQENADPVRAQELSSHEQRAMATLTELNRILAYAQDNVM